MAFSSKYSIKYANIWQQLAILTDTELNTAAALIILTFLCEVSYQLFASFASNRKVLYVVTVVKMFELLISGNMFV